MSDDIKAMEERNGESPYPWTAAKFIPGTSVVNHTVMLMGEDGACIGIVTALNADDNVRVEVARALGTAGDIASTRRHLNAARNGEAENYARAEAAEARLEELTRERDEARVEAFEQNQVRMLWEDDWRSATARLEEAKAVLGRITEHRMQDDTVLEAVRGLSIVQEMARAFLHHGGSE